MDVFILSLSCYAERMPQKWMKHMESFIALLNCVFIMNKPTNCTCDAFLFWARHSSSLFDHQYGCRATKSIPDQEKCKWCFFFVDVKWMKNEVNKKSALPTKCNKYSECQSNWWAAQKHFCFHQHATLSSCLIDVITWCVVYICYICMVVNL